MQETGGMIQMRIMMVEIGKEPRMAEIPHTLESMQRVVGGYIQAVCPWQDPVALVCNEEGLLMGLPLNRMITDADGIVGNFFLCGIGAEDFEDMPEQLVDKYMELMRL